MPHLLGCRDLFRFFIYAVELTPWLARLAVGPVESGLAAHALRVFDDRGGFVVLFCGSFGVLRSVWGCPWSSFIPLLEMAACSMYFGGGGEIFKFKSN